MYTFVSMRSRDNPVVSRFLKSIQLWLLSSKAIVQVQRDASQSGNNLQFLPHCCASLNPSQVLREAKYAAPFEVAAVHVVLETMLAGVKNARSNHI